MKKYSHLFSFSRKKLGTGRLSIDYRLRENRKPSRIMFFSWFLLLMSAYSLLISSFFLSKKLQRGTERSATNNYYKNNCFASSVDTLCLVTFSVSWKIFREHLRFLLKDGCFQADLPNKNLSLKLFPQRYRFRDLRIQAGLFPFWQDSLANLVCLLFFKNWKFGVCTGSVRLWATRNSEEYPCKVLYLPNLFRKTLYLNRFRRKPAISEFDWLFTPSRKSSPPIATDVSAVLQFVLPNLQPAFH